MAKRTIGFALILLLVSQPLFFFREIQESFDLAKFLIAVPLGGFLVGGTLFSAEFRRAVDPVLWGLVALLAAMALSVIFSVSPLTSLYGQSQRYTGFVFFLISAAIFVVSRLGYLSLVTMKSIGYCVLLASSIYVQIQFRGLDPYEWSTQSFSGQVTGLMGNPNTSAAMLGVLIVFPFSTILTTKTRYRRLASSCVYLFSASAIGLTGSFVGVLHISGLFILLVFFVATDRTANLASSWFTGSVAALLGVFLSLSARPLLVLLLAFSVVIVADVVNFERWIPVTRTRFVTGLILLTPALLLQKSTIMSGVKSGFLERGDFYRTAWSVFLHHPLTGSGLDTYGKMFAAYRPSSHALRFEDSISNSAHNVYLGLLSNGGILVFATFTVFLGLVATHFWRGISEGYSKFVVIIASATNFLVIGIFSVEHVALWAVFFALLGLLSSETQDLDRKRKRKLTNSSPIVPVSAGLLVGVMFAFLFARPLFVAARLQFKVDSELVPAGRMNEALDETKKAYEYAPWNGISQLRLGEVQLRFGEVIAPRENLLEGLRKEGFSPIVARTTASLMYAYEDFEGALAAIDLTASAIQLPLQTAELFEKICSDIAQISLNAGDNSLNSRAESLLRVVQSNRLEPT